MKIEGAKLVKLESNNKFTGSWYDPATIRNTNKGLRAVYNRKTPLVYRRLVCQIKEMKPMTVIKVTCLLRQRNNYADVISYHFSRSNMILKTAWYKDHLYITCIAHKELK